MEFGSDDCGGGDAGAAGEGFAFDAALVGADADLAGAENLDEVYIGAARGEVWMETNFVAEVLDHRFISIGDEDDGVRNPGVERMHGGLADGKLDLFVEAKVFWVGEIDADAVTFEGGGNDAGDGFETGTAVGAGDGALDVAGETASAVAAHFGGAAVVIVKVPRPIGFALTRWNQQHEAIRADTALAMANLHDIVGLEFDFPVAIIDENEVVSRPVHLCETNDHQWANVAGRRTSGKWIVGCWESEVES